MPTHHTPPIRAIPVGPVDPPPLFPPNFQAIAWYNDWRTDWTHIVSGKFSDSKYSGLFFYEQGSGYGEFWNTTGAGAITLLNKYTNLQNSWSIIVPAVFGSAGFTGMLFYDSQAGFVAVCENGGNGLLTQIWGLATRTTWSQIAAVDLPNAPQVAWVLYDRSAGHLEVWANDGTMLQTFDGLRTSWTHMIGADFAGGAQLFFYEGSSGHGEIYTLAADGTPQLSGSSDELPAATAIIPGNYGWYGASLLFYDQTSGNATFVDYNPPQTGDGPLGFVTDGTESYDDWSTDWSLIVPGKFWVPDPEDLNFQNGFTDLLFYNRAAGLGEFYLHEPFGAIPAQPLEGYASADSVVQGGAIQFHVNSRVGPYTIEILRLDFTEIHMTNLTGLPPAPAPYPIGRLDFRDGPRWPTTASLEVPPDWPSGLYIARVSQPSILTNPTPRGLTSGEGISLARRSTATGLATPASTDIPFVVRAAKPGAQSKTLVCIASTTYSAYNFWGGRCLYGHVCRGYNIWWPGTSSENPDNNQAPRAFSVSLRRPHRPLPDPGDGTGIQTQWQHWEVPFIRWLAQNRLGAEFCASSDLHNDPSLLQNFRLLVSLGHDEYWSRSMRDNVQAFTKSGGNLAFLSGNICWWQVRFAQCDPSSTVPDTMICYKDRRFDPLNGTQNNLVTVNWYDQPVNDPEATMTGVSYLGTPAPYPGWPLCQQFVVQDSGHWSLANTGLNSDDFFGTFDNDNRTVVGGETDKWQDQQNPPIHSPANFHKVALVFWKGKEAATMGTFTNGGTVFTMSTINWALGLSPDNGSDVVRRITFNVLSTLGEG